MAVHPEEGGSGEMAVHGFNPDHDRMIVSVRDHDGLQIQFSRYSGDRKYAHAMRKVVVSNNNHLPYAWVSCIFCYGE